MKAPLGVPMRTSAVTMVLHGMTAGPAGIGKRPYFGERMIGPIRMPPSAAGANDPRPVQPARDIERLEQLLPRRSPPQPSPQTIDALRSVAAMRGAYARMRALGTTTSATGPPIEGPTAPLPVRVSLAKADHVRTASRTIIGSIVEPTPGASATARDAEAEGSPRTDPRVVVLVPAHNEEDSIVECVHSLLDQTRPFDKIVIVSDRSTDRTVRRASLFAQYHPNLIVMETVDNEHRKCGALNQAYERYAEQADLVVTVDADTVLEPHAVEHWINEFEISWVLAGSQAKFTMWPGGSFLARLQKAEYALGIDDALRRGKAPILAGASSCYRVTALEQVVEADERPGPWSYLSAVEDFELTYQLLRLGWKCRISPSIRAYTDAMESVRALRGQRLKWQAGTVTDLLRFGVNRFTIRFWAQQFAGLFFFFVNVSWPMLFLAVWLTGGSLRFSPIWLIIPAIGIAYAIRQVVRLPNRDRKDILIGVLLIPGEIYAVVRMWWLFTAWTDVLYTRFTHATRDRWAVQYAAEREPS